MPRKSSKKIFRKSSKKNLEDFMPMSNKLTTRLVAHPSQSPPSNKKILIASIVGSIIGIIININALIW